MTLARYIFTGYNTPEESDAWVWTAVAANATPNAEQLAVIDRVAAGRRGDVRFTFEQWLDPELSYAWVERWWRTGEGSQLADRGIDALPVQEQQTAVVSSWQILSNVLRAANVCPYALPVYAAAWERAMGVPTWTEPYGRDSAWRTEIERIAGAPPGGLALGCTVFRNLPSGAVGMACGRDEHRLWLTGDGTLDTSGLVPFDDDRPWYDSQDDCSARGIPSAGWRCARWKWHRYCGGGCFVGQAANSADLYALAPLEWYWRIARETLDWLRGYGPLGAVWAARVNAVQRNKATVKALGWDLATDPGADATRLEGARERVVDQATQRVLDEISGGLQIAGTLGGTVGTAIAGGPIGAGLVGTYAAVTEAVTRLAVELGGVAVARFEDVFGRPFPVLERAEIRTSESDVRALMPEVPYVVGMGLGLPGVTTIHKCGTPGAQPFPNCALSVEVPSGVEPKKSNLGAAVLVGGLLVALGGAWWLSTAQNARGAK